VNLQAPAGGSPFEQLPFDIESSAEILLLYSQNLILEPKQAKVHAK
jgi:hypothetical protein